MRQWSSSKPRRRPRKRGWGLTVAVCGVAILGCVAALDVVFIRASAEKSRVEKAAPLEKLAFLFLSRGRVMTDDVWAEFFAEAVRSDPRSADRFSIYSHPKPNYRHAEGTILAGKEIAERVKVTWGSITVVAGELNLFRAALADPLNQRFLLLSETCAPLHAFACLYTFLFSTEKSFVATWLTDERKPLYVFKGGAEMMDRAWRKGHQWAALTREAALVVVKPEWYEAFSQAHVNSDAFAAFRKQMKREFKKEDHLDEIHHCFTDEHYVQTLLAHEGLESSSVIAASPAFVQFGKPTPRSDRRRRKLLLDINGKMKPDWRARTYEPTDLLPEVFREARGLCRYDDRVPLEPPVNGVRDDVRTPTGEVPPWAATMDAAREVCSFDEGAPSLCYLTLRKLPDQTASAYLQLYKRHFVFDDDEGRDAK